MIVTVCVKEKKWPTRKYINKIVGYIELDNLDLEHIPYNEYWTNIWPYLTFIGQIKIKNFFLTPDDKMYTIYILSDEDIEKIIKSIPENKIGDRYWDCFERISKYATKVFESTDPRNLSKYY